MTGVDCGRTPASRAVPAASLPFLYPIQEDTYVNTIRRSHKLLALAAASTLVIAACGSDDNSSSSDTTAGTTADSTATAPADTTADTAADTTADTTGDINPDAVWDDGTPITFADFKCLADAKLNTPGSLSTVGYDKIVSMEEGD